MTLAILFRKETGTDSLHIYAS